MTSLSRIKALRPAGYEIIVSSYADSNDCPSLQYKHPRGRRNDDEPLSRGAECGEIPFRRLSLQLRMVAGSMHCARTRNSSDSDQWDVRPDLGNKVFQVSENKSSKSRPCTRIHRQHVRGLCGEAGWYTSRRYNSWKELLR